MKNEKRKMKKSLFILLVFFIFVLSPAFVFATTPLESIATIYYSQYCSGCFDYLEELKSFLGENGYKNIVVKDYITDNEARKELDERIKIQGIPDNLRGHLMVFIGYGQKDYTEKDRIILGGHVPINLVGELLQNQNRFEKIYILQDEMHGAPKNYQIWAFRGPVKEYALETSITQYLDWFEENKDRFPLAPPEEKALLPIVIISGLLDGINPCAFAVLIFFIAFLFTIQRTLGHIFRLGVVYIAVIYFTYLGIGLGLLRAIVISGEPHLMGKIGAWFVILLGIINLKSVFLPKLPLHLKIPRFSQATIKNWLTKATLPAVIVGAFLVGLCTFPCSGGIYVAIVGLLALKMTFLKGLGYLLLYNLMFVVPLIILLGLAGNRLVLAKFAEFQARSEKKLNLFMGVTMILLGVAILVFFI